eukprot:1365151-Amphidinium_carterae.1
MAQSVDMDNPLESGGTPKPHASPSEPHPSLLGMYPHALRHGLRLAQTSPLEESGSGASGGVEVLIVFVLFVLAIAGILLWVRWYERQQRVPAPVAEQTEVEVEMTER